MSILRSIAFYVALALGLAAVMFFAKPPREPRIWSLIFDAGHAPLFGMIALLLLGMLRLRKGPRHATTPYAMALVLTILVGLADEALQFFSPRDADAIDWARDIAGALAFLMIALAFDPARSALNSSRLRRAGLGVVAVLLLATVAFPVVSLAWAMQQRNAALPLLCDFDSRWSRRFVEARDAELQRSEPPAAWERTADAARSSRRVARIDFRAAPYPSLSLREPAPDWSGYTTLRFDIFSELDSTVTLVLRIDDAHAQRRYEDRFQRTLQILPGANAVGVPLADVQRGPRDRTMDLTQIRRVVLFAHEPKQPFRLYIGALRLE